MSSSSQEPYIPIGNRLLTALPRDEYERLLPNLELVRLPKNRIVYEAGDPTRYGYFLNSGMASLLAMTDDGQSITIGNVGYEGFVGLPIIHRVSIAPYRVVMMMQGEALRIEATVPIGEFNQNGKLRELLLRYAHVFDTQLVQSFACHVFHSVSQRFARSLLVASDCLKSDLIEITQEQIAKVLGKDRSLVATAAGALRKQGLIRYQRGRMTIVDRPGLMEASCECYRVARDSIDRYLKQ